MITFEPVDAALMARALATDSLIEVYVEKETARRRHLGVRLVPRPASALERVTRAIASLASQGSTAPSDREIARVAEVSPTTAGKLRRQLGPAPAVRLGRDGTKRRVPKRKATRSKETSSTTGQ